MPRDFIPGRREPETPSNTFAYFFREAARRIWISKRTSSVAIGMIAISLFILGAFLLVAENLGRAIERWQGQSHVNLYFTADANAAQIHAVDTFLGAHPDLRRRAFIPPGEALASFKRDFQDLNGVVNQLDSNPFPASYRIDVSPSLVHTTSFTTAVTQLRSMSGVEEVQFDWEWLARLRRAVDVINLAGFIAGGILAVAAAFTIANVIRLTMLLFREEIAIMRLVGATERIIRGPFLIEGFLQGTAGSVIAVAVLYALFAAVRHNLGGPQALLWGFLFAVFLPWQKLLALIVGGMLAGWIGSWISVRERGAEES